LIARGDRAVKRGVEAGNLGNRRSALTQRADGVEVVRLVQRRQGHQLLQRLKYFIVDQHRRGEGGAAVDHPVAGGGDTDVRQLARQPVQQEAKEMLVAQRLAVGPGVLEGPPGDLGLEPRVDADALDDAAALGGAALCFRKQRELDARGTGVHHQDHRSGQNHGLRHGPSRALLGRSLRAARCACRRFCLSFLLAAARRVGPPPQSASLIKLPESACHILIVQRLSNYG